MVKAPRASWRVVTGVLLVLAAAIALHAFLAMGQQHTVVLSVTGTGPMDVSYMAGGRSSQDTAAASPWQARYQMYGPAPVTALTAQNGGSGSISCTITEDGQIVASNTSTGAYAVVQCSF